MNAGEDVDNERSFVRFLHSVRERERISPHWTGRFRARREESRVGGAHGMTQIGVHAKIGSRSWCHVKRGRVFSEAVILLRLVDNDNGWAETAPGRPSNVE